jgi:hypothetical protein
MKFVIVIAASVVSAVLVVPTVTQAEGSSAAPQVHVAANESAKQVSA